MRSATDSLPPVKVWKEKAPIAYARLTHARFHLQALAEDVKMPTENLISPEAVRRLMWMSEKRGFAAEGIDGLLREWGVRAWQIDLARGSLEKALQESEPLVVVEPAEETPADSTSSTDY
jgi:ribonuclease D